MKFDKHRNGRGLDDLYILSESKEEETKIVQYLKGIKRHFNFSRSDTPGHDWQGKSFIILPFGESLKAEIEKL